MRKLIMYMGLTVFPCVLLAQENSKVNVVQSPEITDLMERYKAYNERNKTVEGYRLHIMFSNDRNEAYNAKAKLYKDFPSENCYVEYEQPYYKLRMGDYADRFEAARMLNEVLPFYQGAFVVKDKIQVKN